MFKFVKKKSASNKRKHGIDFKTAIKLWEDADRIIIPARWGDEARFILIAKLDNDFWSAIYTERKSVIRIISVRRSRENEKEIYQSF